MNTVGDDWVIEEVFALAGMTLLERARALEPLYDRIREAGLSITKTQLRNMIKAAAKNPRMVEGKPIVERTEVDRSDYKEIAQAYLNTIDNDPKVAPLRCHKGVWYEWNGCWWAEADPQQIAFDLRDWLADECMTRGPEGMPVKVNPGLALISEVMAALEAMVDEPRLAELPHDRVAVRNGVLNLATGELTPHDKADFLVNGIDAEWKTDLPAFKTTRFGKFVDHSAGKDKKQVMLLQEYLGYLLTPDTSMQKMLAIIGEKRSGKGTFCRVVAALWGTACGSTSAMNLAGDFGLSPHISQSVLLLPDMRIDAKKGSHAQTTELLLSLSGEDPMTINRKNRPMWQGRLKLRVIILSNSMPKLPDPDGVIASRFMFVEFPISMYGKEDTGLTGKLLAERDVILRWAVEGWQRLHKQGRFTETDTHHEQLRWAEIRLNPTRAFVKERMIIERGVEVAKSDVFRAYGDWCEEVGIEAGDDGVFFRAFNALRTGALLKRVRRELPEGDPRVTFFNGEKKVQVQMVLGARLA